jgi:arsenic resistance protein ArsH
MPLRTLADPNIMPALDPAYAIQRPAVRLGPLDPAPRILLLYGSLRERSEASRVFRRLCSLTHAAISRVSIAA